MSKKNRKKLVGAVVAVVLAACAYFYGPEAVQAVKDAVYESEVPTVVEEVSEVSEG